MVKSETIAISNENELKNVFSTKGKNDFYDDQDLKTPLHDKIMDYLINDSMISLVANTLHLTFKDRRGLTRSFVCDVNDKWNKKEEFPIKIGYNFRYIDLCVIIEKTFHYSEDINDNNCYFFGKDDRNNDKCCIPYDFEYRVKEHINRSSSIEPCLYRNDIKKCPLYEEEIKKYDETVKLKMNIDVKTTIPSIGELIRQINTYRELNNGIYVVITPNVTESLENRLKNANIELINTKQLDIII